MRTAKALGSFIVLLAGAFAAGAAHGTTWNSASGLACQVDDGEIMYSSLGAGNPVSDDSANFVCGLGLGTQSSHPRTHDHVALAYQDGNSTWPFACSVCQTFYGGSSSCSIEKYTCANWGGCPASNPQPSPSYTGPGILVWWSNEMPNNVANQFVDGHYYIYCHVPQSGGGSSWIQNYWAGEG